MSSISVKKYFESINMGQRILEFPVSSATVSLAAKAVGCKEQQIAKSMAFIVKGSPVIIVLLGNFKIDNSKYKEQFHEKAKMVPYELLNDIIGHNAGGVCPFVLNSNVSVYLDESLQQEKIVYPAAGDDHSAVKLSISELEKTSNFIAWINVCKQI